MLIKLIDLFKSVFVLIIPKRIRRSGVLQNLYRRVRSAVGGHDEIYDANFYRERESGARSSAAVIAQSIVSDLRPSSVLDVGCGSGELLEELELQGVRAMGLERSEAVLGCAETKELNILKFDLTKDEFEYDGGFDLVVSLEVAEHLAEKYADRFLDLLTKFGADVVFSAAVPGQGGTDHLNEQPHEYWIDKFQKRGFEHDNEISKRWKERWKESNQVKNYYYNNIMVFRSKGL